MAKVGRPKKPKSERLTEKVMVYLSKDEKERLSALARERGLGLSALLMRPWRTGKGLEG